MALKDIPLVHELALKIRHSYWMIKTKNSIADYLQKAGPKKLHLGAGKNKLEGWFNTDYFPREEIYFLDATKEIPAPANSFDYVFSEHHIEHIHYKDSKFMVSEIFRVLKPGGKIRVCTPNLNTYLRSYFEKKPMENPFIINTLNDWIKTGFYNAKNYIPSNNEQNVSFFINDIFLNYDHKFIYDFKTLSELLLNIGFSTAIELPSGRSEINILNNIESHPPSEYTLVIEGTK